MNILLQWSNTNYFTIYCNKKYEQIFRYNLLQKATFNLYHLFKKVKKKIKKSKKKVKSEKKKLWRIWVNCTWCNILGIALDTNPHFSTIFGHFINLYQFFIAPDLNYHFNTIFNHFINLYKFFIRKTLQSIILKGPFQNKNILTIKKLGSWSAKGVALTCVGEEAYIELSKELTLASPLS